METVANKEKISPDFVAREYAAYWLYENILGYDDELSFAIETELEES